MKWKDLSLKERKQIYDSVRVNNPGATYFDIKRQFDSIPEYEDGKDNSVAAVYSLPEVNVYPQNRFGDIARSQGYETAKNWKKVKEGTTAGINTFINSPHAQFVQTMLPLPDGLEHLGSGIKQVKQFIKSESDRYARNVYNNLMPMSYYSSYTGKNKLNEVKEAVKDYIKGKDPKDLNNPKWKEEAYKIFEDDYKRNPNRDSSFEMEPNMALEARMEAFQNYLKLPHEPKYFVEIDKNKRLFDINLDNVPKRNINNWLNNAAELNNNSSRVIIDKLVNTGGNVKMSKTPSSKKASVYLPEFDAYTEYKDAVNVNYEDVWDIQPLSSPGRSPLSRIEIMGTKPFVKEIPNPNNPFGTDIEYRKFLLPDLWKDIEAGKILRGKPFTVKNTIEALEGIDLDGPYITPLSDTNGQINIKNIKDNILPTDINDYSVILDNNIYMPGTANHELGHVADGLAGSRKIQDFDSGKEYITNTYLNYLANSNNTYSSAELRKMGLFDAAGSRSYLLNPTEAKSHMLTLKRSLKDSGKITNWSTPVDENMILEYMRNPTSNKMVKNQYDLYRNKNEYIDRLNKLIPMEILMPLGGAGFVGHELNKE